VTNVSPNHLDVHKSMEEYVSAKKNIFRYQSAEDRLVLNFDNDITREFAGEAKGDVVYFSRKTVLEKGAMLRDGETETEIAKASDIVIPGVHNVENFLAATAAVIDCVDRDVIRKVATTFTGVEHRIELVREINGVKFYNDSIASSPTRTIAGLNSFKDKVILIAGGYDKKIPYDALGPVIAEKVKCLVLIGQTAPKIEKALRDETERSGKGSDIPIKKCTSLEEAVKVAYRFASIGCLRILPDANK